MTRVVLSAIYTGTTSNPLPMAFSWCQTLASMYPGMYNQTLLLHGETLYYGLKNNVYQEKYGIANPFEEYLKNLVETYNVKIVICNLCLTNRGFNRKQLLPFIRPVPFSISYIIQTQIKKGAIVIYDAQINDRI